MKLKLVPTDDRFFQLFSDAARNAADCARHLQQLLATGDGDGFDRVRAAERAGDTITKEILHRLDSSFVTPFDREDIHALAEELDDVVDDMFSAASLLQLADHDQHLPELAELGDILVAMTDEMVALMDCLQAKKGARFRLER